MKRFLSFVLAILVTIGLLGYGVLSYTAEKNRAIPGPNAEAALVSDDAVEVNFDDWLVMRPKGASPTRGVIVYAGANCDVRGYAEIMRSIAADGYLVVGPTWLFNFSIVDVMLPTSKVDQIQSAYPEIKNWVLIGHSMGGATAGIYAHANPDKLDGVIFWDSYTPDTSSLADSTLPVTNIFRATLDGEPPEKFKEMWHVYPPQTVHVPIRGGIHMYFGDFIGGPYKELWEPKISNSEQVSIITAATLDSLDAMQ